MATLSEFPTGPPEGCCFAVSKIKVTDVLRKKRKKKE